ncbi:MAG: family 20 glycosylhydrolase, partial [Candidatus Aminicenantes bacterium]|nr:family 20 glycosylhydrolase [Candidatus Aminicenantes bacterium]
MVKNPSFNSLKVILTVLVILFFSFIPGKENSRLIAAEEGTLVASQPALMPWPASLIWQEGQFRLDEKFFVGGKARPDQRAFKAAVRFMQRLSGRTGLFLIQDYLKEQKITSETRLVYHFEREGKLKPGEDESYQLMVKPDKIELRAVTDIGIVRGFETLLQLLCADNQGYFFPAVEIKDRPRFTWRGLLIDSCRHFMPIEVIKRNLLAMAAVKMNVLHWHLSEDQGFRVESKTFPKLHQLGSDGFYYTQEQIKEIINLASDLGIRVMPEFDIPGHSTSWFVAYPEYASAAGPYSIERKFGVFEPVFDPTRAEVYRFFDKFFKEMAGLFPDPYVHIGGDEVEAKHWKENLRIQTFMKKHNLPDNHALQAYFNREILKILTRYHKKMVG